MAKYQMKYALGGGFGGIDSKYEEDEWEDCHATTEDAAYDEAFAACREEYESYGGLHGLKDVGALMDDEGMTEEEAIQEVNEDVDSWADIEIRLKPNPANK